MTKDHWSCNCFNGLGYIIPARFTQCEDCKAIQKPKGLSFIHKFLVPTKLFNPLLDQIDVNNYIDIYYEIRSEDKI